MKKIFYVLLLMPMLMPERCNSQAFPIVPDLSGISLNFGGAKTETKANILDFVAMNSDRESAFLNERGVSRIAGGANRVYIVYKNDGNPFRIELSERSGREDSRSNYVVNGRTYSFSTKQLRRLRWPARDRITVIYRVQSTNLRTSSDGMRGFSETEEVTGSGGRKRVLITDGAVGGDGSYWTESVYMTYNCLVCSSNSFIDLSSEWNNSSGNWVCTGGKVEEKNFTVVLAVVDVNGDGETFGSRCINASDPVLFNNPGNILSSLFDVSTRGGDFYSEISKDLDISAHGAGAVALTLSYHLDLSEVINISGLVTASHAYTAGTVNALPVVSFSNGSMCSGGSISLGSLASPSGGSFSGSYVSGSTFSGAPPGSHTVTYAYTDDNGCTSSRTATMRVHGNPDVSFRNAATCEGGSIDLMRLVSPTGGTFSGRNVSGSTWSPSGDESNTVTYCYTDGNGCATCRDATMTAHPLPVANAGGQYEVCAGINSVLSGTGAGIGGTYSWAGPGIVRGADTATPTINITGEGTYTLTVTNANGCQDTDVATVRVNGATANAGVDAEICSGDNTVLRGRGGVNYVWSPTTGLSAPLSPNPVADPVSTTTYTLTVTDSDGCQDTDRVTVTVHPTPAVTVSGTQQICKGEHVQLNAASSIAGSTFEWLPSSGLGNNLMAAPVASPDGTTTYTATTTTPQGCTDAEQVIVLVNNAAQADAGSDFEACTGVDNRLNALQSSGTGALTYSWSGTGIMAGANTAAPTINIASNQIFTLTVEDENGCSDNDQVAVSVNKATANAGIDRSICLGDNVQLSASGGVRYHWAPATGLNDPTSSSPLASPPSTTTYTVTVTDSDGCQDTDRVTVTVFPLPTMSASADQTICEGDHVILSASGAVSYRWRPSSGLNVTTLAGVTASPRSTTVYTVEGTSIDGCTIEEDVIVFVNPLPTSDAGSDMEACTGVPVALNGSGNAGTGPYTYLWTGPGAISDPTLPNPEVTVTSDSDFTLQVTDANGCTDRDEVRVRVTSASANAGANQRICLGESIALSATGGNAFQWDAHPTLSDLTISDPIATPTVTTVYRVTVTNSDGCQDADEVTVTVDPVPALVVSADQTICEGESVAISATGADSYVWTPRTGLNVNSLGSVLASPTVTTVYTVTGTNSAGCSVRKQIVVNVNENPVADAGSGTSVCSGTDLSLRGSAQDGTAPYTSLWSGTGIVSGGSTASPTVNITNDQVYTLTVTDVNGCTATDQVSIEADALPNAFIAVNEFVTATADICVGTTIQLEAFGGDDYVWSGHLGISNPAVSDPTITVNADMALSVLVTDANGCQSTASVTLNAVNNPVVEAGPVLNICVDHEQYDLRQDVNIQGGTFSGPGIENDVEFDPSGLDPGVYSVTYNVSEGGCSGSDVREIRVKAKPTIAVEADRSVCRGSSVQIAATGGLSYAWFPADGVSDPESSAPKFSPVVSTAYTVTGTDQFGCTNIATVDVEVNDLRVSAGTNQVICEGSSVTLAASANNRDVTYSWHPATSLNDASVVSPVASPGSSTVYEVTVTDIFGCTATDEVTVTVESQPQLSIGGKLELCHSDRQSYDLRSDVNIPHGTFSSTSSGLDGVLFNAFEDTPGIYFVDYEVTVGTCVLTAQREVEILESPAISLLREDFEICLGESAQLVAGGGVAYEWSPAFGLSSVDVANPEASPAETTLYTVTVTDGSGCRGTEEVEVQVNKVAAFAGNDVTICEGESVVLEAEGGDLYSWDNRSSLSNPSVSDPTASPNVTTTYTVSVTDNDRCTGTDQVTINVMPAPALTVGGVLTLCTNDTDGYDLRDDVNLSNVAFSSESRLLSGVQAIGSNEGPGIYFVTVTAEENGCTISEDREIHVVELTQVTVLAEEVTICKGQSVQLSASGTQGYRWEPSLNIDDPNIFNPVVDPEADRIYTVFGTDINGCETSAQVEVRVEEVNVLAGSDVTICEGERVTLEADGADLYQWDHPGLLSDSHVDNPEARPEETTTFTVTGTSRDGCSDNASVTVTVLDKPVVDVGGPQSYCVRMMTRWM